MMQLAQRLFFHNLANNRGVLTLMVDRADEEDLKEDMLLYFFLLRHPVPASETGEGGKLDRLIEDFLARAFRVKVDFEISDALPRLRNDGLLIEEPGKDGMVRVVPPERACKLLEKKWRVMLARGDEADDEAFEEEM